jgi:hypothetical protein
MIAGKEGLTSREELRSPLRFNEAVSAIQIEADNRKPQKRHSAGNKPSLLSQNARCFFGKVGHGKIRTGPPDGDQRFEHRALWLQPSFGERSLEHRIFA